MRTVVVAVALALALRMAGCGFATAEGTSTQISSSAAQRKEARLVRKTEWIGNGVWLKADSLQSDKPIANNLFKKQRASAFGGSRRQE